MRVEIDGELCSGHGRCKAVAPEFYELDYDGYNAARGKGPIDVPAGLESAAVNGESACPEAAISLIRAEETQLQS